MATQVMKPKHIKPLKIAAKVVVAIIGLYLLAALIGSTFPANQSWNPPTDGIELFIETNGVHTGITMPIRSDAHDWSHLIRREDMVDPAQYGSHVLIGWGHAGVYRNSPQWQDLRFTDAASAILGSHDVLLHVYHLDYPQAYPHYRRSFKVSEDEYRKIASAIEDHFVLTSGGKAIPSKGYGADDLFYEAKGHYNAFNSCNNWTADILRKAGVRAPLWTPFSGGVMKWFADQEH